MQTGGSQGGQILDRGSRRSQLRSLGWLIRVKIILINNNWIRRGNSMNRKWRSIGNMKKDKLRRFVARENMSRLNFWMR